MNNKIKSIVITQNDFIIRNVTDEELDIRGHLSNFTEFDQSGHLLKEIKYDRSGLFEDMHIYTYDDKGFLITDSYYPEENEEAEKITYENDETGLVVKTRKKYLDGSVDTTVYSYDENKRLEKMVTTSDDGEPEEVEVIENPERPLSDDIPDTEENEARITRNEKGQIVLEEVFSEDDQLLSTIERKYNEDENLSEVEVFIDGQGKRFTRHYILRYEYTYFTEPE
jgi:hypothetical protein